MSDNRPSRAVIYARLRKNRDELPAEQANQFESVANAILKERLQQEQLPGRYNVRDRVPHVVRNRDFFAPSTLPSGEYFANLFSNAASQFGSIEGKPVAKGLNLKEPDIAGSLPKQMFDPKPKWDGSSPLSDELASMAAKSVFAKKLAASKGGDDAWKLADSMVDEFERDRMFGAVAERFNERNRIQDERDDRRYTEQENDRAEDYKWKRNERRMAITNAIMASEPGKKIIASLEAANKVAGMIQTNTPPGDVALLMAYMKSLDPGSTVMLGEQQMFERSQSAWDSVQQFLMGLKDGKRFSPELKKQALEATGVLLLAQQMAFESAVKRDPSATDYLGGDLSFPISDDAYNMAKHILGSKRLNAVIGTLKPENVPYAHTKAQPTNSKPSGTKPERVTQPDIYKNKTQPNSAPSAPAVPPKGGPEQSTSKKLTGPEYGFTSLMPGQKVDAKDASGKVTGTWEYIGPDHGPNIKELWRKVK
jgi:hypothetical protein